MSMEDDDDYDYDTDIEMRTNVTTTSLQRLHEEDNDDDDEHTSINSISATNTEAINYSITKTYQDMSTEDQKRIRDTFFDAARAGNVENLIECIHNIGIPIETQSTYNEKNVLHPAICHGQLDMVMYLINECSRLIYRSAVHDACTYGHLGILKYLFHECNC
jgi:hypothetical protein